MNDRDIEDTRMPPDERECFTCSLCDNDHDLTGLEVLVNDNVVCDTCVEYIAADYIHKKHTEPSSFDKCECGHERARHCLTPSYIHGSTCAGNQGYCECRKIYPDANKT